MRDSSNIKTSDETFHNIPLLQDSSPVTSLSKLDPICHSMNLFSLALSLRKNNSSHFFCTRLKQLWGLIQPLSKPGSNPGWRPESICWEESCSRAGFLLAEKQNWIWGLGSTSDVFTVAVCVSAVHTLCPSILFWAGSPILCSLFLFPKSGEKGDSNTVREAESLKAPPLWSEYSSLFVSTPERDLTCFADARS